MKRHLFVLVAAIATATPAIGQQQQAVVAPKGSAPVVRLGSKPQEVYLAKITVADLQKSLDFYTNIVGMKLVTVGDVPLPKPPAPGAPEKDFVEVSLNYSGSMADPMFVLMKRKGRTPTREQAALTGLGFKVADIQATADRAAAAGFKPNRPFVGPGSALIISDPDGYTLEIMQAPSFGK